MKKEMEQHLKSAFQELTPNHAEEIWNMPVEKAIGNEWYLDRVPLKKTYRQVKFKVLSMIAACFVFCTAMYLYRNFHVQTTVYLDVNPSVELQTNTREKVVRAVAHNKDGEKILADMNLEDTDVDVALNAILGSMVKQGYLSEAKHMILLSVEGDDQEKADAMCVRLEKEVDDCLQSLIGTGKVYTQSMQNDSQTMEKAKEYGISPGKVVFIQKILEENPELEFETLAQMSMSELEKYMYPEEDDDEENETEIEEPEENIQEDTKENPQEYEEYESPEEETEESEEEEKKENPEENPDEDEEDSSEEED